MTEFMYVIEGWQAYLGLIHRLEAGALVDFM